MIQKNELRNVLNLCKKNDRRAQKLIYDSYYNRYFTLCMRYLNNDELAAGTVNEMFFNVFTKLDKLKDFSLFEGWMKRICINVCLNQIKKNKKHVFVDIESSSHLVVNHTLNNALDNLSVEEIFNKVKQLPSQMRCVFNLYIIEGFKHNEIAEMLDISVGTSKYHLHQAKARLKEAISGSDDFNKKQKLNSYG